MAEYLGMERGPQIDVSRHLTEVFVERIRTRKAHADYDQLLAEYNSLYAEYTELAQRFSVQVEAHKMSKAALQAREDQLTYVAQNGVEKASTRTDKRYKNGDKKSVGRLFYEEKIKEHGQKLGLSLAKILKFIDI